MAPNPTPAPLMIEASPFPGVKVLCSRTYSDERGCFTEAWQCPRYEQLGLRANFVQDNVVTSRHNVLRGLHYQIPRSQVKLVTVLLGEVFDVVVDIQKSSPSFGKWFGIKLSAENNRQLWIEPGYAHGYQVLSEVAVLSYKCSHIYEPADDCCISWCDPQIGIQWLLPNPTVSPKDARARNLSDCAIEKLFI